MTTPYGITRNIGSLNYNGYVNAPVIGPLSTNQYPCSMSYHNFGTLTGIRPTPPQFYPSQEPVNNDMNINARKQYIRATSSSNKDNKEEKDEKQNTPYKYVSYSTQRQIPISSNFNYIAPIPSSMYVNIKKSVAVGKTAYKVGLPLNAPTTTKNYYPSGTRSALRRARSGGSSAPKKKGSIYNVSLRQSGIYSWGALPRQTY
jgi:hypothetical protein